MKTIALVCGGYSGEYTISLQSAEQIENNLKDIYSVYKIIIDNKDRTKWYYLLDGKEIEVNKNDFSIIVNDKKINFDFAFIIVHGTPGENGLLQGYFDMIGLKYNTCSSLCSAITFDKLACNLIVSHIPGVNVAKNMAITSLNDIDEDKIVDNLSLPVFVKPTQGGSSIATFKVEQKKDLRLSIQNAIKVNGQVIVEQFIKGREFSCGVMKINDKVTTFPITEIVPKTNFFDYKAKYDGLSDEIVPADISEDIAKEISFTTQKIYSLLRCKGVCRIDYILRPDNTLFFLEVNTTPGQSLHSIVPNQVRQMGHEPKWLYVQQIEQEIGK